MNAKDSPRYFNICKTLTLLSPEKSVNVVYQKAPIVSVLMTTRAFSFGFLDAIWQIKTPQQRRSGVTQPATARAEFKGRDFTESLCWARGLVEGLHLNTVCLVPCGAWFGAGMPLGIRLSCSLLARMAAPGFKAVV